MTASLTELVLVSCGFQDVVAWQNDELFGKLSAEQVMRKLGYKTPAEWEAAILPLHREIRKLLMDALMKLWYAIGKEVDVNQFRVYVDEFDGYPPEVIDQAVSHLLKTHRYTSIPTIAEIHEAIEAVVQPMFVHYAEFAA